MSKKIQRTAPQDLKTSPWVIGGIVVIALLVVAVLVQSTSGRSQANSAIKTPDLTSLAGIPTGVTADGHPYRGSLDAKVVMVEYEDLRCPYCQRYFLETEPQVLEQYVKPGLVRIESRMIALLGDPSVAVEEALACAGEQGKYWEFRQVAFANQPDDASPDGRDQFVQYAQLVGVNVDKFKTCFDTQRFHTDVQRATTESQRAGVNSTPTFLINGVTYNGAFPFLPDGSTPGFRDILDAAVAAAK